jgi:hypothetical protein
MRKKLGQLLAWAVTLSLLVYIFRRISFSQMTTALHGAESWTIPVLVVLILGVYLGDSFAIWKTFGWFVTPLSFREVMVVRGATYLLAFVNYTVGQGAIIYFVNRSRGVPILRGTAAVLMVMGINILLLLLLTTLGLFVNPDLPTGLRNIVLVAYGALAVYITLLIIRPRWLTSRPIFDVLFAAGLAGHVKALAVRIPHIGILMVFSYSTLHAFGVKVPVTQALLCLPIVYFISVLPIAVMGLGTTQFALGYFFWRYVPGATSEDAAKAVVVTASLVSQMLAWGVQGVIGAICMRNQLARQLREPVTTT